MLAGSVLALETVKRALVLSNRSRDLLVAALLSGGLLPLLLRKLDWRRNGDGAAPEDQVLLALLSSQ